MSAVECRAIPRPKVITSWFALVVQIFIAISFELGDDLGRGLFSQHGTTIGIKNARDLAGYEAAHGFWFEPAWQLFFLQTRHVFVFTITWLDVAHAMNVIYVLGHIFVTLAVAIWVYFYRRRYFVFLRNTVMLVNAYSLVVYERFPVAPPRLTTNLIWDHHEFEFQDTVFGTLSKGGRLVGSQLGYNEFSAFPSVHMGWALVAGLTLLVLGGPLLMRIFGGIYPLLMLLAIVVTGNHYLIDAFASVGIVLLAAGTSYAVAHVGLVRAWPPFVRQVVVGEAW